MDGMDDRPGIERLWERKSPWQEKENLIRAKTVLGGM